MTEVGLKEDNLTNSAEYEEYANQLHRRPQMTGQAREEE